MQELAGVCGGGRILRGLVLIKALCEEDVVAGAESTVQIRHGALHVLEGVARALVLHCTSPHGRLGEAGVETGFTEEVKKRAKVFSLLCPVHMDTASFCVGNTATIRLDLSVAAPLPCPNGFTWAIMVASAPRVLVVEYKW